MQPSVTITEFSAGLNSGAAPREIAAGPEGNMWFADEGNTTIGRITTAGVVTQYPVPNLLSLGESFGITTGPDGALWFTISTTSSDFIGRITTTGVYTQYKTPTATSYPFGIITGPDGALWFVERSGNKIGRIQVAPAGFVCTNTTTPTIASIDSASAYGAYSYFG